MLKRTISVSGTNISVFKQSNIQYLEANMTNEQYQDTIIVDPIWVFATISVSRYGFRRLQCGLLGLELSIQLLFWQKQSEKSGSFVKKIFSIIENSLSDTLQT